MGEGPRSQETECYMEKGGCVKFICSLCVSNILTCGKQEHNPFEGFKGTSQLFEKILLALNQSVLLGFTFIFSHTYSKHMAIKCLCFVQKTLTNHSLFSL